MAFFLNTDINNLNVNKSYTTGFKVYKKDIPIKVYVVFNRPFTQVNSDILTQISPTDFGVGIIKSDTLNNINHLNYTLGELSSYYWVWKNDIISEYIGFFHYRRYLSFERDTHLTGRKIEDFKWDYITISNLLKDYDLIIPPKFRMGINAYQQYCVHHDKFLLDKAIEIIKSKYSSEYIDSMNTAMNNSYGYYCNLLICKREIFNNMMTFIFDILDGIKEYINSSSQPRALGFVGERLYNIYIHYLINYSNIRIAETPQIYINDDNSILINTNIEDIK